MQVMGGWVEANGSGTFPVNKGFLGASASCTLHSLTRPHWSTSPTSRAYRLLAPRPPQATLRSPRVEHRRRALLAPQLVVPVRQTPRGGSLTTSTLPRAPKSGFSLFYFLSPILAPLPPTPPRLACIVCLNDVY